MASNRGKHLPKKRFAEAWPLEYSSYCGYRWNPNHFDAVGTESSRSNLNPDGWLVHYGHIGRSCGDRGGSSWVSSSGGWHDDRDAAIPDKLCSTLYARVLFAGVVNHCALWGASSSRDWVSGGVGDTAEKGC
jgi:hypothetical protein